MIISNSVEATLAAGRELGRAARRADVVALVGDLGAGKTQFVKGLVDGIGCDAPVTSPTFTLVHEYEGGRLPVYHFDFYRLETAEAAIQLGLDEYLSSDGICVIEWADRFPQLLPPNTKWITLSLREDGGRVIQHRDAR